MSHPVADREHKEIKEKFIKRYKEQYLTGNKSVKQIRRDLAKEYFKVESTIKKIVYPLPDELQD